MAKRKKKKPQTFMLDQSVQLTDEEVASKAQEMAGTELEYGEVDSKKKELTRDMNEKLKGLRSRAEQLASQVRSRVEVRPVECVRVLDSAHQRVATLRVATNECVDIRDMEPEEVEQSQGEAAFVPDPEVAEAISVFESQMEGFEPSDEEVAAKAQDLASVADFDLTQIKGVTEKLGQLIAAEGFGTLDALRGAIPDDLVGIPGIGAKKAEAILLYVENHFSVDAEEEEDPPPPAAPADAAEADDDLDAVLGL